MGMLCVQTVCKRYQQMTLGDKELSELVCFFDDLRPVLISTNLRIKWLALGLNTMTPLA